MADIAWVNGRIIPAGEPAIAPVDAGFLYGWGLFETMRAYGGVVFRLLLHTHTLSVELTPRFRPEAR